MKTNRIVIGLVAIFGMMFCLRIDAQTNSQDSDNIATNLFSLSMNDFHDWSGQEESYFMVSKIHRVIMPETLSADEDTNDIWGIETNGLQLSIRFRDGKYRVGDIIPAITILRNLDTNSKNLLVTNSPSAFLTFMVRCGTNGYLPESKTEPIPRRPWHEPMASLPHGLMSGVWDARSEKEFVIDLNKIFDLSQPGEYTAKVLCRIYSPATKLPLYEVSSGTTTFQIVKKTPPAP